MIEGLLFPPEILKSDTQDDVTQNVKTHKYRTTQKTKKMSNTNPTKHPGVTTGTREG